MVFTGRGTVPAARRRQPPAVRISPASGDTARRQQIQQPLASHHRHEAPGDVARGAHNQNRDNELLQHQAPSARATWYVTNANT